MKVEIKGINEVRKNMSYLAQAIPDFANQGLNEVGNRMVNELRNEFPDLNFIGMSFPENMEYWIVSNRQILCWVTGKRVDTKTESQVGRERGKQTTPFKAELNMEEISNKYGPQIAQAIEERINAFIG